MKDVDEDLSVLTNSEMELTDKATKNECEKWSDKKVKWQDVEVITLFEIIKKHNLLSRNFSDIQLGESLADSMSKFGFTKTPYQIMSKIRNLRQSYLKCIKSGCTEEALKECLFFDLLDSVFNCNNLIIEDSVDYDNDNIENIWEKEELETMLSYIIEMKLKSEITLRSFSLKAISQISKALEESGYNKSVVNVETALQSLKTTFIQFKRNYKKGQSTKDCPYYRYLNRMWGEEYAKTPKSPRPRNHFEDTEIWSEEETIMLLTSIKELDIINDAFRNTEDAAEKLLTILNDSGYLRTKSQIQSKMENLMKNYIEGKRFEDEKEVLRKFPFFSIYDKIFGSYFENFNFKLFGQSDSDDEQQTKRATRGPSWSHEEIKTLLNLIIELNLAEAFREQLTMKILEQLVVPMKNRNFPRTALQIKIKMRTLRMSYRRCIEAGCTSKALAECPFYNELNDIYKKSKVSYVPSLGKTVLSRKIITETNSEASDDAKNTCSRTRSIHQFTKNLPRDDKKTWTPIETIRGIDGIVSVNEEEEREVYEEQEFEEGKKREEQTFKEVKTKHKKDKEIEVMSMVPEKEIQYADFFKNFDIDFDSNIEEMTDNRFSFEDISDFCLRSLEGIKENSITEYLPLEEVIPEENEIEKIPIEKIPTEKIPTEKIPIEMNEESQLINRENSSIEFAHKSPMKVSENSSLKRNSSGEMVYQIPERKRKLDDDQSDSLIDLEEFSENDSLSTLLTNIMKHESEMQKQHQEWLEHQFEIQREHDRQQRRILLNELKEFRQAIMSVMKKNNKTNR